MPNPAVMLPFRSGFAYEDAQVINLKPWEAASRLVSCKLLFVVKFYLNISYGRFYGNFHPREEAVIHPT
ncbi:hypothetical protein BV378_09390 [Nostoc sp. RF31YmG]|nr:hypothetical protein BV378_09390 [Nostoc sp. RF31YmG]OUL33192.1 hypothetical protein BV375_08075 [Nostoc sp. 106C]